MNCPMIETRGNAAGASRCRSDRRRAHRRDAGQPSFAKRLLAAGEQLFRYRYVRAGLIERLVERAERERGEPS